MTRQQMADWVRHRNFGEDIAQQLEQDGKDLRELSDAYLRLRALIPGAFNTPHAPTSEQVWHQTEKSLKNFLENVRAIRAMTDKMLT